MICRGQKLYVMRWEGCSGSHKHSKTVPRLELSTLHNYQPVSHRLFPSIGIIIKKHRKINNNQISDKVLVSFGLVGWSVAGFNNVKPKLAIAHEELR